MSLKCEPASEPLHISDLEMCDLRMQRLLPIVRRLPAFYIELNPVLNRISLD